MTDTFLRCLKSIAICFLDVSPRYQNSCLESSFPNCVLYPIVTCRLYRRFLLLFESKWVPHFVFVTSDTSSSLLLNVFQYMPMYILLLSETKFRPLFVKGDITRNEIITKFNLNVAEISIFYYMFCCLAFRRFFVLLKFSLSSTYKFVYAITMFCRYFNTYWTFWLKSIDHTLFMYLYKVL